MVDSKNLPVWRSMLFVPVTRAALCRRRGTARRRRDHPRSRRQRRRLGEGAGPHSGAGGGRRSCRAAAPMSSCASTGRLRHDGARPRSGDRPAASRRWRCRRRKAPSMSSSSPRSIDEIEAERGMALGTTKMLAMVETASAFFRIHEIAKAHPAALSRSISGPRISHSRPACCPRPRGSSCRSRCASSRRAPPASCRWGLSARSPSFTISTASARRCGARAGSALSAPGSSIPSQVAILNEEFRPSAAEVDHARRVVAAYDKALAEGVGAVTVDGKMIDVPVVERAKLLLEREAAIALREEKKRALGG